MKELKCHLWQKDNITNADLDRDTFELVKTLVDSSHLDRSILKCKQCGQLYFFEFYEEIDWEKGNDPQYSTWVPIESDEQAEKMSKMSPIELLQFSPRLQKDFPSDADKPTFKWIGK